MDGTSTFFNSAQWLLITILFLLTFSLTAQRKLQTFEVKQYGLSIDQPFHSSNQFSMDSLGRLLFDNYSFDGVKFEKRQTEKGRTVKIEEDGSEWRIIDQFNIKYITQDSTYEINTNKHFKYTLVNVEIDGDDKYLLTNLGIVHFRKNEKELIHVQDIPLKGEDSYNLLLQGDTLFIKKLSEITYIITSDPDSEYILSKHEFSDYDNGIFYLKGNRVCLKSQKGFNLFPSDHPYSRALFYEKDYYIISHLYDSKKRLWINYRKNSRSHLYLFDNSEVYEEITLAIENSTPLTQIFEDLHGSIWIGTRGGGLLQLYEPSIQVLDKNSGLSSNNIRNVIQKSNKDIYLTVDRGGIDIITKDNLIHNDYNKSRLQSIFFDREENLWFPAYKGIVIHKKNGVKLHYTKEDGLMSSRAKIIFQDSKNQVWVGTRKGLNLYNGDRFKAYAVPGIHEYDRVIAVREYVPYSLLVGFESGKVFKFMDGIYEDQNFPAVGLNTIFTDRYSNTWLCSENAGLFLYVDEQITPVKGHNLPLSIRLVQDDKEGNLWGICEKNQLFRLNIQDVLDQSSTPEIEYFGINEGVPLLATNSNVQPNSTLLDDGRVVFPNIYGAILINPEKINQPLKFFSTECFFQDSIVRGDIKLNYGQNDISLKLNTINIAPNQKVDYEHNIGDGWFPVSGENRLDINNLTKGTHTIQLRGKSSNGEWHTLTPVVVNVPPLFYQYTLFWIVVLLLMAVLIYLYVTWKTYTINQRNKLLSETVSTQLKEIEKEKSQLADALEKQKVLTQELNISQATKNRMYAQISHEFKSPLQAIKSYLTKGEGYIHGKDKGRMEGNIDNLLAISNEIMELSKAESGNLKVKKNYYNINGVIADQVELKRPLAAEKDITIVQPSNFDKQYINFDISLIQKVIGNLLSNAIKFSPIGGEVTIFSKINDNVQEIQIKDQGPGIPDSDIEHLTLAYYQASNNTKAGTGIGLSLVKEILKLHDSKLNISSELKKGSTFGFKLKRPDIPQEKILANNINTLRIDAQIRKILDPDKPVILAVDDSHDVLFFINQTLSTKFYIITTENGEETLDLLNKINPSAIISNFNMPMMNGMELLRQVRKIPKYQALPFVVLTGSSSEEIELQSVKAGADLILRKPIQEDILTAQVSQLLQRQKKISAAIKSSFSHDLLPTNILNDDLILIQKLESIFLDNISNGKLKSVEISNMMGIGEKTLRNRIKDITGKTIKEYFRIFRLEKAKLLLQEGYGTIGEVASATGFSSLSYFSKSYKAYINDTSKNR